MYWWWSLPDWRVVRYVRLVVSFDSSEATVCWFSLDFRVRDYVRSSLHLSSMTKRFWFSSTERNTEFGEHILLLSIQRLRQPGLESTPYFFAYNWVSSLQYLLHRLLFIPEWAQIRRLECKVVYEQSIRLVEFFQGAMTCTWCWAPPAAKSRFQIILLFSVLSALLVTVLAWYYM